MKLAYFDCFAGVSGDMILGALIDLGLPVDVLERELKKLPVGGYQLRVTRVEKLGVMATKVDVLLTAGDHVHLADSEFKEVHPHHHHHDQNDHDQHPPHEHGHPHQHDRPHERRSLSDILRLIDQSELEPGVKSTARQAFERLGEAESKVHGLPAESIHFHEVGGTDAIVDVVGCAIGLAHLGIEEVHASPVHLGQGMIKMAHGLYPIPGPATANLLVGVPTYQTDIKGELTTPTGAAILTAVSKGYGPMPPLVTEGVGYGAGTRDRSIPNVLRIVMGQAAQPVSAQAPQRQHGPNLGTNPAQHKAPTLPSGYHMGRAVMIECNIDDMNPQLYDYVMERLSEAGAMDVYLSPVQMKKNRPAMVLHVLTMPDKVDGALQVIFAETTTIGVRTYEVTKRMLQRELQTVQTEYGSVRVKVARLGEQVVNVKPEYDDCKALAQATGAPLKLIEEQARVAGRSL